jgi:hypothetical protein
MERILTLDELKQRPVEELLREIIEQEAIVVVRLPDGGEVVLEAKARLRPLPILPGHVPPGWKDALYAGRG